jgi:hypothetical protein
MNYYACVLALHFCIASAGYIDINRYEKKPLVPFTLNPPYGKLARLIEFTVFRNNRNNTKIRN